MASVAVKAGGSYNRLSTSQPLFSKRFVFYTISSLTTRFRIHFLLHVEIEMLQQLTFKAHSGLIPYFLEMFRGLSISFATFRQENSCAVNNVPFGLQMSAI